MSNLVVLALEWLKLHTSLKALKALEHEKRAELVLACFPGGLSFGVNRADLQGGYVVKVTADKRGKIDPKTLPAAIAALKRRRHGSLLLARLFKWTPELRVGEWDKLSPDHQALFTGAVSLEKASPSVELVEPS